MELNTETYRTLHRLPTRAGHVLRYRAAQLHVMREIELRLPGPEADPEGKDRFRSEGRELSLLDDEHFLPVLDAGTYQETSSFYVVPLRRDPTLAEALRDQRFGDEERCSAARHLAYALAALHERDGSLGPPDPELLAWDWGRNLLYCLHHVHPPRAQPSWLQDPLPPDVQPGSRWTPQMDLFYWALFSYWMLSRGEPPFLEGPGIPTPIRLHLPALSPDLAHALEAGLAWKPEERPETATEIRCALLLSPGNLREGADLAFSGVAAGPAFQALVDERRRSGRLIPEEMRQGIDKVGLAPAQEGGVPERTGLPGALSGLPQEVDFPNSRPTLPLDPGQEKNEDSGMARVLGGLALGVLFGVVVLLVMGREGSLPLPPPALVATRPPSPSRAPVSDPSENPGGGELSLAPSKQASYRKDPAVQRLLRHEKVSGKNFRKVWSNLRTCVLSKKLPSSWLDEEGLMGLRKQSKKDLDGAARDLEGRLAGLRKLLGYRPGTD